MYFFVEDATIDDLEGALNQLGATSTRRLMLIELFFAYRHSIVWRRPTSGDQLARLVGLDPKAFQELVIGMVRDDLMTCQQDMKSGQLIELTLGNVVIDAVADQYAKRREHELARRNPNKGPRGATPGVRKQTHHLFEGTCELCGDKAIKGKDQRGKEMQVARVKKDQDGVAENVTLLCSACATQTRTVDLPSDCRTLSMLQVAEQRGYADSPRTAVKPVKEVVITAEGAVSVKSRSVNPST